MTWQLGYQMHAAHRDIPASQALAQAKAFRPGPTRAFTRPQRFPQ
jgi:hypothetical protein